MALLLPILIGLFIGLTAGMFGIGGALMATPLLKLFVGLPSVLALATPLPATMGKNQKKRETVSGGISHCPVTPQQLEFKSSGKSP